MLLPYNHINLTHTQTPLVLMYADTLASLMNLAILCKTTASQQGLSQTQTQGQGQGQYNEGQGQGQSQGKGQGQSHRQDEDQGQNQDQGQAQEAISLYTECYETRASTLGHHHPDTLGTLVGLVDCHQRVGTAPAIRLALALLQVSDPPPP